MALWVHADCCCYCESTPVSEGRPALIPHSTFSSWCASRAVGQLKVLKVLLGRLKVLKVRLCTTR